MRLARLLARLTRGSALAEIIVVFPVFMTFFSMIVQLAYLEVAGLAVQHTAIVGVRAAIVVAADDPRYYGSKPGSLGGQRQAEVDEAMLQVLRRVHADPRPRVSFSGFAEGTVVKAHVELDYKCQIPIGRWAVCGRSLQKTIIREAALPSQTPGYEYP